VRLQNNLDKTNNRLKTDIMELNQITIERVEDFLKAWQQHLEIPSDLLQLDLCASAAIEAKEGQWIFLHDKMKNWVSGELTRLRALTVSVENSQPISRPLDHLRLDFSNDFANLEAISALHFRYFSEEQWSVEMLATAAGVTERHFRRKVSSGLEMLVWMLRTEELLTHRSNQSSILTRNLPLPDYNTLVGNSHLIAQTVDWIDHDPGKRMISLEGIGGIGKTSVARAVAIQIASNSHYAGIAWISAKPHDLVGYRAIQPNEASARSTEAVISRLADQLGQDRLAGLPLSEKVEQLKPLLKQQPYFAVIDNLETIYDVSDLIPILEPLSSPSTFLLTSRHSLSNYPFIQAVPVPELSFDHSFTLVKSELDRLKRKIHLKKEDMEQIYGCVGGLPLALKLITSQIGRIPLSDILSGVRRAEQQDTKEQNLYRYIYQHTWNLLGQDARQLLISSIYIPPDGAGRDWLLTVSDLGPHEFDEALSQLLDFSLFDVFGSSEDPAYRIHRLTISFLQTKITKQWENE